MSGDSEYDDYDEVSTMKRCAIAAGVSEDDILLDPYGLSTYESLIRFRDEFEGKRVIIVTQKYHLYRALYVAEKLDYDRTPILSSARQYASAVAAEEHLREACEALRGGFTQDVAGMDLELALSRLLEIDGRGVTEEITDRIFRRFCVGK